MGATRGSVSTFSSTAWNAGRCSLRCALAPDQRDTVAARSSSAPGSLGFNIAPNWSAKVEYLYMDLGSFNGASASATTVTNAPNTPAIGFNTVTTTTTTGNFGTRFTDNIIRVGVNYRFSGPVVAKY